MNIQTKLRAGCLSLLLAALAPLRGAETSPSFDGDNSYINLGTAAELQIANNQPFTVEGWIYLRTLDATRNMLFCKNNRSTGYSYLLGFIDSTRMAAYTGSVWKEPSPSATISAGAWRHAAYSYDGTNMAFFIDGALKGTAAFTFVNNTAHPVSIGGFNNASDIDGLYSDVRLWNHARSAAQVAQYRDWRLAGTESGLLGYWPLNEGTGTKVYDRSAGIATTGTLVNAVWLAGYSPALVNTDALVVAGVSTPYGSPVPPYGATNGLASSDAFVCSAPLHVSLAAGVRAECRGYALFTNVTMLAGSGVTNAFSYTHGAGALLEWRWQRQCEVLFSAAAGGTVGTPGGWYDEGSNITVTATADGGYGFLAWSGNLPVGKVFNPTLTLTVSQAQSLTALFFRAPTAAKVYTGTNNGLWSASANWAPAGEPSLDDAVFIPQNKLVKIPVTALAGALTVSNGAIVSVNGATATVLGRNAADTVRTDPVGLTVAGSVLLRGSGSLAIGGVGQKCASFMIAGGSLTLADTAVLAVYPGPINASYSFQSGGARVSIQGATVLNSGTWIYPYCHTLASPSPSTGAPVVFDLQDLTIAANAGFNAGGRGYTRYSTCPGYADSTGGYIGGSHGGRGGKNATTGLSALNPFGLANAPFYPGGAGGNNPQGGGAIRIDARNVLLEGRLLANGSDGAYSGGGAGGGIWITCDAFSAGSAALISAKGGLGGTASISGGGGGGRVAIGIGLTSGQIDALYATGTTTNVFTVPLETVLMDRITVAGSIGGGGGTAGLPGSAVFMVNRLSGSDLLVIGGNPGNLGTVEPVYGPAMVDSGSNVVFSSTATAFVSADERSRRVCGGYAVTNTAGEVKASGTTTGGSVTVDEDLFLVWDWTQLEHLLQLSVNGSGHIATNAIARPGDRWQPDGSTLAFTAVPDAGFEFIGWIGTDVYGSLHTAANLQWTHSGPLQATALFAPAGTGAKVWTGLGDGSSWTDAANWLPASLPGRQESVLITNGTPTVGSTFVVEVGSLMIGSKGTLVIPETTFSTFTRQISTAAAADWDTVGIIVNGALTISGKLQAGTPYQLGRSVVTVHGDLAVNAGGSLEVNAGYGTPRAPATFQNGGGNVTVKGATTLASGGWIYPRADGLSGAPVIFDLQDLTVGANAGFNADTRGFFWTSIIGVTYSYGPGASYGNQYAGGCHGGKGGRSVNHLPIGTNYCHATAPCMPGSPGGNNGGNNRGGGAIRIGARSLRLYGTLTANGTDTFGLSGGGSGGGIWVTCASLRTGSSTALSVKGGNHVSTNGGGGGGGRIALAVGLSDDQIAGFYSSGRAEGTYAVFDLLLPGVQAQYLQGTLNVAGGTTTAVAPAEGGQPGTAVYIAGPPAGLLFIVR